MSSYNERFVLSQENRSVGRFAYAASGFEERIQYFLQVNAERLMTLRTSAVAASRAYASAKARLSVALLSSVLGDTFSWAVSINPALVVGFLAGALPGACFRAARVFAFAAERIRLPRLRSFAFDSPRLICRRPGQRWSECESTTPLAAHHIASERPAYDSDTHELTA